MTSNGQPPLTRRQVRELERAREAGEAITGSISVVSGSPVPSAMPVTSPAPAAPASSSEPTSASGATSSAPGSVQAPGSAHTATRRELRAQREAAVPTDASPVPLRAPKPEHERDLSEALSHVADIENGRPTAIVPPREAPRTVSPASADPAAEPAPTPGQAETPSLTPPPLSTPTPAAARPTSVPPSEDDDDESPAAEGLPTPVSAGRDTRETIGGPAVSSLPSTAADSAVPGPRRHGTVAPPEHDATVGQRIAASTPPPSSTPTVFPFALNSASAPEPETSAPRGTPPAASDPAPLTSTGDEARPSVPVAAPAPAGEDPVSARPTPSEGESTAADATASPAGAPETPEAAPAPQAAAGSQAAPRAQAPAGPQAAPRQQASIPASVPEPSGYVPPTGHWSTQADLEDDTIESVGSHFGSMTSTGQHNALIIGDDQLPDVTGALNATGEVIITGSIDLPRSLAATGSHHAQRIDGSDIDRMLEEGDREQPDSDATPVRASRAVSANTSTRAVVLAAGKPKTNRLPIIASICVGIVVVVIVGLVVVGFATHVL
ncbi:hypothetical protein GCM10025867_22780 [Frondihabitans sucicola]|uniref:Uncharacterized protein n=1 Tax=Frondihabitans sucicola TaxID=1268041 RepID=A0ABN6XYC1_9MICO|nr:hypothetical protein [Frondihabitans sucicola]BDZ50037.1 hypothetical protein GCM10025867_22780 [Frondihabitans sucicola]